MCLKRNKDVRMNEIASERKGKLCWELGKHELHRKEYIECKMNICENECVHISFRKRTITKEENIIHPTT